MWDFFKTTTLSKASSVLGIRKCTRSFVSNDTLDLIDKIRRARLGSLPEAMELKCQTLRSLRADKEDYVHSICERAFFSLSKIIYNADHKYIYNPTVMTLFLAIHSGQQILKHK